MLWELRKNARNFLFKLSNFVFGPSITHRSQIAKILVASFNGLLEKLDPAHRKQARFERLNPDAPWFVPTSISTIESLLKVSHIGFEWGSGRSTLWFAQRVSNLISVEGRKSWHEEIQKRIIKSGLSNKIRYYLIELSEGSDNQPAKSDIERYVSVIDQFPNNSLDFIVVDGHFRVQCLERCLNKIKPGGFLILDNSDLPEFHSFLKKASSTKTFSNSIWETTIIFF